MFSGRDSLTPTEASIWQLCASRQIVSDCLSQDLLIQHIFIGHLPRWYNHMLKRPSPKRSSPSSHGAPVVTLGILHAQQEILPK